MQKDNHYIDTYSKINKVTKELAEFLNEKNKRYGDSALNPINIFNKHDADIGLCLRMDDKISRIRNSEELRKNDIVDLMGYLTLLCISKGWLDFKDQID